MSKTENRTASHQSVVIEDLTINQGQAEEVKGGPIYMKIEGISGDVTTRGYERPIE